jgi:hypothetical protein
MAELNYCQDGGWVVSGKHPLPADPGVYYPGGLGGRCGCNNLVCRRCGRRARTAVGLTLEGERGVDWAAVYERADWTGLSCFRPAIMYPDTRLYVCACGADAIVSPRAVEPEAEDLPPMRWRCGGHPRAYSGMVWHGIELRDDTDFVALVGRAFAGRAPAVPAGIPPESDDPGDLPQAEWLRDLYRRLLCTAMAEALSRAVAAHLTHEDPLARGRALRFFLALPLAPGRERLLELAQGDRALFRGHEISFSAPVEWHMRDLEDWLMIAVAEPLCQGQRWPEVISLLRREVLTPGRATPVLEGLCQADGHFVVDNAEDIVRGTPQAAVQLLLSLQRAGQAVGPVGARIAVLPGVDRGALREAARDLLFGSARNQVLKALKALKQE